MPPELSLSVQYATPAPELPRWRLRRWVQHALKGAHQHAAGKLADIQMVSLTLRLVDSAEGQELNREFRQRDYATNILTFAYGADPSGTLHADLVLCVPVLEREASQQNKPLRNHAAHLTLHGVLHAVGYDHTDSDDAQEMEALETALLAELGIPDPYLA
ncbi:MAG: rRNA maturation RNase YbeY [Burkholderiaceae bacterium]|nr:rRNA maturation RNase YbeY [Burkholderiaceae bacterium]